MFDFEKVTDFESHIQLSIPNYSGLCDVFRALVSEDTHSGGVVLDIGCSTGFFLNSISKERNVRYVGCDVVDIRRADSFEFVQCDAGSFLKSNPSADVVVSMFTLQFLGRHKRSIVLKEIKRLVDGGAAFLVAEKVFMPSKVESVLKKEHVQQKRKHFTDSEILDKERELFGSMHCVTLGDFRRELKKVGACVPVWQSYNFIAYHVSKR
jgi:SAM-dependent methyltransferase